MRSATSSTMMTSLGIFATVSLAIVSLYSSISRTSFSRKVEYLFSISSTAHCSVAMAFCALVMISSIIKCGRWLYIVNSTCLGSMSMSLNSSGEYFMISEMIMEFRHTLLPMPVAPATR